jgi:hypothetical protein
MPRSSRKGLTPFLLYWTDRVLRSPASQVLALAALILSMVLAGALALRLAGAEEGWGSLLLTAWSKISGLEKPDEGTPVAVIVVALVLTMGQWFIFAFLVSLIGDAVQKRLATIRSGATYVYDRDHTVVLGWNNTVYAVLDLLSSSDEGPAGTVAVLAAQDKQEMEAAIRKYCHTKHAQRTICRSGAIDSLQDLERINLAQAREVIIIGDEAPGAEALADGHVLRSVLACNQVLAGAGRRVNLVVGHCLAQSGRLIKTLCESARVAVAPVDTQTILAKLVAQCAWQPGLARVYRDLLTYGGDPLLGIEAESSEVYCEPLGETGIPEGTSFEEALWGVERAIPIGYIRRGELRLNPSGALAAERLRSDDLLVLIAGRRDGVRWSGVRTPPAIAARPDPPGPRARNVLLLGKGPKARAIVTELVTYLPAGSVLFASEGPAGIARGMGGQVEFHLLERESLADELEAETGRPLSAFDTVVITSEAPNRDEHDTVILTQISAIWAATKDRGPRPVVVAELLEPRNQELATTLDVWDVLISPELVSNYMVQLTKDPSRALVYADLLEEAGMELYVRPSEAYFARPDQEVSFLDLMAAARGRREIAIGYMLATETGKGVRVVLNPEDRATARPAGSYERVVVLAE